MLESELFSNGVLLRGIWCWRVNCWAFLSGASICRFKRLSPDYIAEASADGRARATHAWEADAEAGPNTSECFCCGRSTGPYCRLIIANLTIFYIYSFLNVPPLLRHFRMIFVYSFLYVWNVTSCVETMEHF